MTRKPKVKLRLYVAGDSPNSALARHNLQTLCQEAQGSAEIEIVDVLQTPGRALEDRVLVTPTLIKLSSRPQRLIGTLSEPDAVRALLGLTRVAR